MSKPVLVAKFAYSVLKYALVDVATRTELGHGKAHRIGDEVGELVHWVGNNSYQVEPPLTDNRAALAAALKKIRNRHPDTEIGAMAHQVSHGADLFTGPTLVDESLITAVEKLAPLAPEHNPVAANAMRAALELLPDVPHVAIFDTAFFADLPRAASTYALPTELSEQLHIRKYGFHGTTHAYVSERASLLLGHDNLRQIVCYLGKGSSISAVSAGLPIDVSSGLTTLEGLPMRSRCGTIDPGIHSYVVGQTGMSLAEFDRVLGKESGMYGLTGLTDMRQIWAAADAGDARAQLAIDVCVHRIVSYIAAYHVILGGAQAISFTGVIGENDFRLRRAVCERLAPIGVRIDRDGNNKTHNLTRSRIVSATQSDIVVMVVPQKDSQAIARQTAQLLGWRTPKPDVTPLIPKGLSN